MGCCQTKDPKFKDKSRVIDHFMPPGPAAQPRYTYRLEKVEEVDVEKIKPKPSLDGVLASNTVSLETMGGPPDNNGTEISGKENVVENGEAAREHMLLALSEQLKSRLGTFDAPVVGEDRYLLVETPIGTGCNSCKTEQITADEEELVRQLQEKSMDGLLFISNTLGLATFEVVHRKDPQLLLEPLPNDAGVDFDEVLDIARDKGLQGWRFRGALRGRPQVQDFVLSYAMYPDVVVTPFSHLVFSNEPAAQCQQIELVELRGTGTVLSGALIRIVKAWARRGWRLGCVMYNLVTTYDKVTIDPPEQGQSTEISDALFSVEEVGGQGQLSLYFHVAAYFERRLQPSEEGQRMAKLALQQRLLEAESSSKSDSPGYTRSPSGYV